MNGGYSVPLHAPEPPKRKASFIGWDFHDDCPHYDRILTDWGWIDRPVPISPSSASEILKKVWTAESLEQQFYRESPLLKLAPPPKPKKPWWKFW
jgi:hypothetical protein